MKAIWIIFLVTFSLKGFSQETPIKAVIHTWAGGQCCSSGTDITITISDDLIRLDFDSLVYRSSSGQYTLLYQNDFHTVNTPERDFCTLTYGWSNTKYGYDNHPATVSYYGLPQSRFRNAGVEAPKLLIYRNNRLIREGKVDEQFTMTAYP